MCAHPAYARVLAYWDLFKHTRRALALRTSTLSPSRDRGSKTTEQTIGQTHRLIVLYYGFTAHQQYLCHFEPPREMGENTV
jgi:hypothetical protein